MVPWSCWRNDPILKILQLILGSLEWFPVFRNGVFWNSSPASHTNFQKMFTRKTSLLAHAYRLTFVLCLLVNNRWIRKINGDQQQQNGKIDTWLLWSDGKS